MELKKGKYGEAATGDMIEDCDVWLEVAIDETADVAGTVCTPVTLRRANNCKLCEPSADNWYSWQSGSSEQAWLENSSTRRRLSTGENCRPETLHTDSSRVKLSTAVKDGVLPIKRWLVLVVRNLL